MAFERVYTVHDYFDGPRSGVADYLGRPHHYSCDWDLGVDSDMFALIEIDEATLSRVLEQWEIFRQWEWAFHRGEVSEATHPGIPGQHQRYAELNVEIQTLIANVTTRPTRARAKFRADPEAQPDLPAGMMRTLQVEWQVES
jgi:hypothetical protein